jgi:quinol-cytochrome oxidoreductase complex cytochrome b subunit
MRSILLHLHPKTINPASIVFNRTFGLGGMAILLILIQVFTGVLLRFYYISNPVEAYNSIVFLKTQVLFGQFIRNIHYWSAVFLIIVSFLHFLRVFFTGAYRDKRKMNWIFGLLLLLLIVFSNFTGYLLPWDQLAYWAITVSTNIIGYLPLFGESFRTMLLGGKELNAYTLQTFYTLHTAVLPFLLAIIVLYHIWKVRKAGGVLIPDSAEKEAKVPVMPNLVFKEFIVALVLIAVLFLFSALFNAPLLDKANPAYSMNPTKAPWYFAGVQELLMHFHPFFAAFVLPIGVMIFLSWIPFIHYEDVPTGHWFNSLKGKKSSEATTKFAAIVVILGIILNEYIIDFEILLSPVPAFFSNGLLPLFILFGIMFGYHKFYLKKLQLNKAELVQAVFVFLITAFIVLTIAGIFFRGKDMELTFPWNI